MSDGMTNGSVHAFPHMHSDGNTISLEGGLTKREYFAGLAMQGQLAFSPHDSFDKYHTPESVAEVAVKYADALLRELSSNKESGE